MAIVTFHTKIHLDLTAAMAKRLGIEVDDEIVAKAVEEQRMKNKMKKADEDWARDNPDED